MKNIFRLNKKRKTLLEIVVIIKKLGLSIKVIIKQDIFYSLNLVSLVKLEQKLYVI